mgnify:CR=1 FL=1
MEISKEKKLEREQREKQRNSPLNKMIVHVTKRDNGRLRIQFDYSNCPTRTEQHSAHETDINYLMKKYQPDELASYIAARNAHRQEIVGHDFSREPSLQDAKNMALQMKKAYDELPEEIKKEFPNHLEFLKFIDNPRNQEKMIKMGLLKPKEIEDLTQQKTDTKIDEKSTPTPTPTKEKEKK